MTNSNNNVVKCTPEPEIPKEGIVPLKKPNKTEVLVALIRTCEEIFNDPAIGLNTGSWEALEATREILKAKVQGGLSKNEALITDLYMAGFADALAYVKTLREAERAKLREYNPPYL
ncbi:hypothetical protein HYX19_04800 [Candidatus Woesearchaeota archaeon]|nr:hypothetical protein [Candidatus Woesearchaeota archaeon]